ncbi:MAG: 50S ribosomal protein L20 [Candidatus Nitrospinota bacterium M3_3B_026]
MPRVKNSPATKARRKKILKMAKGYRGARSRTFLKAKEAVTRASQFAYRDRRARKRDFRALWITRINAAARAEGMKYSTFMRGLSEANVEVDRKILADLAVNEPEAFRELVGIAREKAGAAQA